MRSIPGSTSLFLLLLLCSNALAQYTLLTTKTICKTALASTSKANVPTVTKSVSRTKTRTFTLITTPITKVTPAPITKTTTSTVRSVTTKTESAITKTITTTSTTTTIITSTAPTSTAAETVIETTTINYTTTVPVLPEFTPVLDTLPGAQPLSAKKIKRSSPRPHRLDRRQTEAQYPSRVKCNVVTKSIVVVIIKKAASTTKTITVKPSTVLQTATTTVVSTTTVYPPNSFTTKTSTTTVSSITTITPVYTSTYTTTETYLTAVATSYPQCSANARNFAGKIGDTSIQYYRLPAGVDDNYVYQDGRYISPEECCSICYDDPTCAATFFYGYAGYDNNFACELMSVVGDTCDETNPIVLTAGYYGTVFEPDKRFLVSNNKCGKWGVAEQYTG